MKKHEKLSALDIGKDGLITDVLTSDAPMRRRLYDLGFIPGAVVKCIMKSPLGDPRAYLVAGSIIALRRFDADKLITEYEVQNVKQ
ncbi:MAG: FeoA family protein [Eubacteriales bacterium]|nr:FeoA family protein [Eubacteriales bacterium]